MTDKNESANGVSQETGPTQPQEVVSADFRRAATLVGQLLDERFLIEKDLTESGADEGGIGLVYLARDMKLMGREVVVKILQKKSLKSAEFVRKFQHEKEALIRLDHPNIVRILDSGTLTDGNPFMVMEYISGYSLRKLLREKRTLPFEHVAHIAESVTNALAAAHAKKILHRDLKPENVMLTPQEGGLDQVKLIDFGIARVEESQLAPQTSIGLGSGTLIYISPEQLAGKLEQTPAIDIYAFSIVVYEMLTGSLPFMPKIKSPNNAVIAMYEMQKKGVEVRPGLLCRGLPARVEAIVLSGLEYDPAKRPQDARQFGRDLAWALRQAPSPLPAAQIEPGLALTQPANEISVQTADKQGGEAEQDLGLDDLYQSPVPGRSKKYLLWAALALLILTALAIPAGIAYWNGEKTGPAASGTEPATNLVSANDPSAATERRISYFLNVQKMRDGKPFEVPFRSSGQDIYESGYKFTLVFQPDADGNMYLFSEGKDAQGNVAYNLLFPSPSVNSGSAQVAAQQQIETARNTFNGGRGTEVVWMIWTKQTRDDLETIARSVVVPPGTVNIKNTGSLQRFIEEHKAEKPESSMDTANERTILKTKGDTMVHRFELQHR